MFGLFSKIINSVLKLEMILRGRKNLLKKNVRHSAAAKEKSKKLALFPWMLCRYVQRLVFVFSGVQISMRC